MPKKCYISREVFASTFPSVYGVDAKFQYNFFVRDESLTRHERIASKTIEAKPVDTSTADAIDRSVLQKKVPRYVLVSFRGNKSGNYLEFDDEARSGLVTSNKRDINLETHMTTNFFTTARFQDSAVRKKIMDQVFRLAELSEIDLDRREETSQEDIAETVDAVTGDYISKDVLLELVHEEVFKKTKFINSVDQIDKKLFDDAQEFKSSMHIDSRFISDIYTVNNCKLNRGIRGLYYAPFIKKHQEQARSVSMASINLDVDYEPSIKIINEGEEVQKHQLPKMASVGYVIVKSKIVNGVKRRLDTFYMDGVHNTQFLDPKVAYGQTYIYEVCTVTLVEMTIDVDEDEEEPTIQFVRFLVQGKPSSDKKVLCVEDVAPPPPEAIFYRFDYDKENLMIDWRMPITPQRDIKGFQVFRRTSIERPFELQKQFMFDDSILKYPTDEKPFPNLIEKAPRGKEFPVLAYEDTEFDRGSKYIYTLCSIDAHGYLSNYGTQTEVMFDRNTNRIRLRNISQPGAPRQYPNMYISPTEAQNINGVRISEDVMKDSMHNKMRVYFDPEYFNVSDTRGRDLKHLASEDKNGVYKFEVLNIDRQKSKTLTIKLKNRRSRRYRRRGRRF